MKKSLACTVLAGLLMGGVMTGVEAADPIDIVINQDGSVTPSTYSTYRGVGVYEDDGITDIGSNVKSIRTDGKINTKSYSIDYGYKVGGVVADGSTATITGNSISEIVINSDNESYGIYSTGNTRLYDVGKIDIVGYGGYGAYYGSDISDVNILTFSGDENKRLISVNSMGIGTEYPEEISKPKNQGWGLSINGGTNYVGTYLNGAGALEAGHELAGIDVVSESIACGIGTYYYGEEYYDSDNTVAFNGKNSYIRSRAKNNTAHGIDIREGHGFHIYGLGSMFVSSQSGSACGIANSSDKNVDIHFSVSDDVPTIKVVTNDEYCAGIDAGGSGSTKITFDGSGSVDVSSQSGAVYGVRAGIYDAALGAGTTTIIGLKDITVGNSISGGDGYGLELFAGTHHIGTYLDGGGNKVTGKELHSINVAVNGDAYGIKCNVYGDGESIVAFDGQSSFIKVSGGSVYGILVGGDYEFEISGIGRIDVSSRALDEYDGARGIQIFSGKNSEIAFDASDSEPTIKVVSDSFATGISLGSNDSVTTKLTGIKNIVVNSTKSDNEIVYADGISISGGLNEISFTEGSSIEVVAQNSPATGILVSGGNTTITGLKNISVSDNNPSGTAIYVYSGSLRIGDDDSTDLLTINGQVYIDGGTLKLKNAVVMGNLIEDTSYTGNESQLVLDKKIIVNGNVTVENEIKADDAGDDFTFGKGNDSSSTYMPKGINVGDVGAKITIYGSDVYIGDDIVNKGQLIINPNAVPGYYGIYGDVHHNTGANTEINLVGEKDGYGVEGDARGTLDGNIFGSDENFKMTLDMSDWILHNEEDGVPVVFDPVYNVSLKRGANVYLNPNTQVYLSHDDQSYRVNNWEDRYSEVTFKNLKNDGTGYIALAVDLANNTGDKIILNGDTPAKLGVALVNKDDNEGEEFAPDGEHKVTYAAAPLGSELKIDTTLVPVYGKQSMIYTPIVEETANDMREWNFVGWTQRSREDSKLNAKDELDIPDLLPEMEEKRLEEIHRYAVHKDLSELGAWVRGETGKMSADGVDFDVKVISGGYDWANKTSKGNFFMGVGVSHGTSDADMGFVGDSKNTSFSVYGSWYGRKNYDYIDFVAKYGKIDHQYNGTNFDGVLCSGEYDKKMYSFFAKYGRRLPLKNGFYVEPFGSVTYGHIGDADFYDNGQGAHMHVNSILSKIVSVGAMFGRSVKGTELYCKLAYSYDFDGEIRGSVPEQNYSEKTDMGGSSYKFAVGASRNLGKQNSLHLDLEKDFGGKMKRPWNLALTFKHTW